MLNFWGVCIQYVPSWELTYPMEEENHLPSYLGYGDILMFPGGYIHTYIYIYVSYIYVYIYIHKYRDFCFLK